MSVRDIFSHDQACQGRDDLLFWNNTLGSLAIELPTPSLSPLGFELGQQRGEGAQSLRDDLVIEATLEFLWGSKAAQTVQREQESTKVLYSVP